MATITAFYQGGSEEYTSENTCIREYLVEGDLTYEQTPRKRFPYLIQSNWPGSAYRVKSWSFIGKLRTDGDVELNVMRVIGTTGVAVGISGDTKVDEINKDGGTNSTQVTAEMIGARRATWEDAGYYKHPTYNMRINMGAVESKYIACKMDDGEGGTEVRTATLTGDQFRCPVPGGGRASLGDYVYNNAYARPFMGIDTDGKSGWLLREAESSGSPNVKMCPWVLAAATTTPAISLEHVGMTFEVVTHKVTFRVRTDRTFSSNGPHNHNGGRVTDWGPDSGRKYGPTTLSTPATGGQWRIASQSIGQDFDYNGQELLVITREFMRVPYTLSTAIWNPALYDTWSADWP